MGFRYVFNGLIFVSLIFMFLISSLSIFSSFSLSQSCLCEYGEVVSEDCPSGFLARCSNEFDCVCRCGYATTCDDNNECTQDYCFEDSCNHPLTFSAKQCEDNGGTCDPVTGDCDEPAWPECNPSDPCCDDDGHYEADGTVCNDANVYCNGTCEMQVKVNRCHGGSCNFESFDWEFSHFVAEGEVCVGAGEASIETDLSCNNYCDSSGKYCIDTDTVGQTVFGCDGKGDCATSNGIICEIENCGEGQICENGVCVGACECSSGACCDGCNYYGTDHVCSTSSVCGGAGSPDKCQVITAKTYCSGTSENCDGETKKTTTNVASGKVCDTATNTIVSGSSTNYAFESAYNRCSEPTRPDKGFGMPVKDVYACNGANAQGRDVGDMSMLCSNGCCYDSGAEAFCDIFGNQAYNYWDFGIPDQTRNDYCVDLGTRQVKDCKDDEGCRSEFQAKIDTNHSQAFYLCTNQYDCKRSCYAQACLAGQYTCTDYYWNGTSVTYYCVNSTKSIFQSSFVFNPVGNNPDEIYCNEDEYNDVDRCRLKQSQIQDMCFLPNSCGKTGIASLFDTRDLCGGKMGYCNFSSGEIVSLSKNYVKIPANTANPPRGQGEFPHAGRVFGYNYVVYEPNADNANAIGFSKLAKFNNDGTREESGLYWDTCSGGNVVERYSNPSFSTESSSVFSKQYNCECLNIDYPNYDLAICKTNPGSSQTPVKTITYTP